MTRPYLSWRTIRSQYRIRYGQPLRNDGVSVDLTVILCVISATTISIHMLIYTDPGQGHGVVERRQRPLGRFVGRDGGCERHPRRAATRHQGEQHNKAGDLKRQREHNICVMRSRAAPRETSYSE